MYGVIQLLSVWDLENVFFESALLLWTALLAAMTAVGLASAYICMVLVVFPLLIREAGAYLLNVRMFGESLLICNHGYPVLPQQYIIHSSKLRATDRIPATVWGVSPPTLPPHHSDTAHSLPVLPATHGKIRRQDSTRRHHISALRRPCGRPLTVPRKSGHPLTPLTHSASLVSIASPHLNQINLIGNVELSSPPLGLVTAKQDIFALSSVIAFFGNIFLYFLQLVYRQSI